MRVCMYMFVCVCVCVLGGRRGGARKGVCVHGMGRGVEINTLDRRHSDHNYDQGNQYIASV